MADVPTTYRCDDEDCGWEGVLSECDFDAEPMLEPCEITSTSYEFNVEVTVTANCPQCGNQVGPELDGGIYSVGIDLSPV